MIGVATYQSRRAAEVIIGVDTHLDRHVLATRLPAAIRQQAAIQFRSR